ncbi:adenosine kinase [Neophaeococcomyces mojaviensis]|uniref:Adenosine kinase n=1 Tax=Neophaeococcomyces mojaviensis TaxID=3383035 RepID=A0ACC3A126_9EURO|nr:adenosine kinase [Knufia sp. JES_112]
MAAQTSYALLCLENPLLDIQGHGDRAMIAEYGMKLNDTILVEDNPKQLELYDDLIKNHDAKLIAGGGAQNTARGAQYMLPPNSTLYIGCVGDDEYADILRKACKEQGVHVEYRVDPDHPTGRCGVIITDHHRTMCTNLAAANQYKLEHLQQPQIWSLVESSRVYYVGGYHLTVCPPAAMALATHAAKTNKPFCLGLSAGFIPQFFKDQLAEVLPYTDYLFGNENEAKTWAENNGVKADASIPEIAKALANVDKVNKQRPRIVIITQGTDPTIVATGGTGEVSIQEFPVLPIEPNLIVDTTGAGDAFAAGFLAGIVLDDPIDVCVKKGQWLAKLSLQELGPSYPFPKRTYGQDN